MSDILGLAKGINGQIELYENKIVIKRQGFVAFMTQGFKGDKEILLKHISSMQCKKVGFFTSGYIQFAFLGGSETKKGLVDAAHDENTVMFNLKQQEAFLKLKEQAEKIIYSVEQGSASKSSGLDEIEKLASLRDKGILSEEEFIAKKKQLLDL